MKIGLIGFGSMGKTHAYCVENLKYFFEANNDVKIKTVCTKNILNAKAAKERYGFDCYTDNEDDIIYDPEIDAVDICTPNIYHYETCKKSILAGKHVYCEKPLAVTYEQAKELSCLADKHHVVAHMVFNNRFLLPVIKAKKIIDSGKLGKIISFNARYLHSSAMNLNKTGWKQDKDICGGGVLFDLGAHVVDLMYFLVGEFYSVYGKSQIVYPIRTRLNNEKWQTNADEAFYLLAQMKNGAHGVIEVSKVTTGANDDLTFEIHAERGSLKFNLMNPNFLEYYNCDDEYTGYKMIECVNRYEHPAGIFPGEKAPIGWLRGHIGNYYSFVSSVCERTVPSPSFKDGAYVQAVLEGAYKSDIEKKEVQIVF